MKFRVAARADREIRVASGWWEKNRPYAPGMFAKDLESAFDLIEQFPYAGEPVSHQRIQGLRRVLMNHVRYYVYYSVSEGGEVVEILALRHTSRGAKLRL